ncbi:MAG TPA: DMT family transporter, partial [Acetobacteraceae bacterium]|nr:DMT family transporter [Acetobacteraceae bacterium]
LLLATTMLAWSGNTIVGRAVVGAVPPVTLAFLRWTGAALLVAAIAWRPLRRDLKTMRRAWPAMLLLSATGIAVYNTVVYAALHSTTALNALLLQSITPLFVLAWDFLLFRQSTGPRQVLAILISLAGVAVITAHGSLATLAGLRFNGGDLLVVAALADYALYTTLLRLRPLVNPLSFVAATCAIGAVTLAPFAGWELASGAVLRPTPLALGSIAYVCLVPSALAYLCFNRGVELIGAARAGQYMHLIPVFGTALAVLLLGEQVRAYHFAGIALIAAGLVLASRRTRGSP